MRRAHPTPFYLQPDGGLSTEAPVAAAAASQWTHDPERPVPTLGASVAPFLEWQPLPRGISADYLITRDQGYSPDGLREHGVEVVAPDDLLCRVFDDQPQAVLDVLELQAGEWGGGRPVDVLLEAFERAGAAQFSGRARAELTGS